MFDVTRVVLKGIIEDTSHATGFQRGDANIAYSYLQSFEFVLALRLMKGVIGRTDTLCQALQKKSQDILNAMEHDIDMPDFSVTYTSTRYRPRKKDLQITFEHYYRVDLLTKTLDRQLYELDSRFNEQVIELLFLSATLCSKEINVDQIVLLGEKNYLKDFTDMRGINYIINWRLFKLKGQIMPS
ncbi:uncharacterized protein LOC110901364 [Helianthus annuus]|uniref:uncharacterized protein LOC110901364 n=1 Tax=Helianthus annuus TaxID=4232 RepID=UPI000B8F1394|nr:uncharacterized protein LOC110901364 [Helianthus annuus]